MKYVDLVIDNKSENTDNLYTYGCEDDDIRIGQKVCVPFNRGNTKKDAYVFKVADEPETEIKGLKYVIDKDPEICLTREIIDTCCWMRSRYLCKYIDAVKCFTPAGNPSKRGSKRNPYKDATGEEQNIAELTQQQKTALEPIASAVQKEKHELFLLHGITGSGKTEIYMRSTELVLDKGRNVIVLVPEISLTAQMIDRFIGRFGAENIAVLHSKLSLGERYDEWMRIKEGKVRIVIGARSAVFAPASDLGLVIMDEEHETTYKSDMTPKYETAEVAIKRLKNSNGILLAGSATPSVVTYSRAREGIYTKLELTQRYNETPLPEVETVDMRSELRSGNISVISKRLLEQMKETLAKGEQIILFLNRRGYSNFVSCRECGEAVKCPNCGISLTYHKESRSLVCHYCGHRQPVPTVCPGCGSKYIKYFGTGTEKVEETVSELFPDNTAGRLDLDTVKRKGSINKILNDFKKKKIDILIGTQLVAKGLDFRNVGLVGIVSADVTLNIPDFRSPERTFQLVTQAAGRAGRGEQKGGVIIQSYTPDNYAVKAAAAQDYRKFYEDEILLREYMKYPPYSDLIQTVFASKDEARAEAGGQRWREELIAALGKEEADNVFPLQPAPMNKIKETYRYCLLIKSPKGKRAQYAAALKTVKEKFKANKKAAYTVNIDINPYSFL